MYYFAHINGAIRSTFMYSQLLRRASVSTNLETIETSGKVESVEFADAKYKIVDRNSKDARSVTVCELL